jgi:hypothetical protein
LNDASAGARDFSHDLLARTSRLSRVDALWPLPIGIPPPERFYAST